MLLAKFAKDVVRIIGILGGGAALLFGLGVAVLVSVPGGIAIGAVGCVLVWWIVSWERKEYLAYVAELNRETGCNFAEGFGSRFTTMRIDPDARKLALMTHGGAKHVLFDFSEIDDWQLRWTEVSGSGSLTYRDVHLSFRTTRLEMPVVNVPMSGKANGEAWSQKLRILLS